MIKKLFIFSLISLSLSLMTALLVNRDGADGRSQIKTLLKQSKGNEFLNVLDVTREAGQLNVKLEELKPFDLTSREKWRTFLTDSLSQAFGEPVTVQLFGFSSTLTDRFSRLASAVASYLCACFAGLLIWTLWYGFSSILRSIQNLVAQEAHEWRKLYDRKEVVLRLNLEQERVHALLAAEKQRNEELSRELEGVFNLWGASADEAEALRHNATKTPDRKNILELKAALPQSPSRARRKRNSEAVFSFKNENHSEIL